MIAAAIKRGSKEWRRSKLHFVGEGRAGKTAVTNSMIGRAFEQTASTVGINQLTCDVKQVKTGTAEGQEQLWVECVRQGPEWESAIAVFWNIKCFYYFSNNTYWYPFIFRR